MFIGCSIALEVAKNSLWNSPAIGGSKGSTWAYLHVPDGNPSIIWSSNRAMRFGYETSKGSGYTEAMRITNSGKVGIGIKDPQAKLHVNGRIKAQDPIDNNDVATKAYVDAQAGGGGLVLVTSNTNQNYGMNHVNAIKNFVNNNGLIKAFLCCRKWGSQKIYRTYWSDEIIWTPYAGSYYRIEFFLDGDAGRPSCDTKSGCHNEHPTRYCTCGWKIFGVQMLTPSKSSFSSISL